jgi:hypothetical protein
VTLGLCSQIDLDFEVTRAAKDRPQGEADAGQMLLPAEVSTAEDSEPFDMSRPRHEPEEKIDVNSVFAKLKGSKRDEEDDED